MTVRLPAAFDTPNGLAALIRQHGLEVVFGELTSLDDFIEELGLTEEIRRPEADHSPCGLCRHPLALHCPARGCQQIEQLQCKAHEDNDLCRCPGEALDG